MNGKTIHPLCLVALPAEIHPGATRASIPTRVPIGAPEATTPTRTLTGEVATPEVPLAVAPAEAVSLAAAVQEVDFQVVVVVAVVDEEDINRPA